MAIARSASVVNAADFGADPSLANNSPAIQSAIDAGYKIIRIPVDTVYKCTDTITVDADDVWIVGEGPSSVLEFDTDDSVFIHFTGASSAARIGRCGIESVWIRGYAYDNTPAEPSGSFSGLGVRVQHCFHWQMRDCYVSHFPGHAVFIDGARGVSVDNCFFFEQYWDNTWATYSGNADVYTKTDEEGVTVTNNVFTSNSKLHIFASSNGLISSMNISDNIHIPFDTNGDVLADANVDLIHAINYYYGSFASTTGDLSRKVIANNIIHKTKWCGIYATASNTSPPDTGCRVAITGNVVSNTGIDHTNGDDGLQGGIVCMGAREVNISNNLIVEYIGWSSNDGDWTGYGAINLNQQTGGTRIVCNGNIIRDCRTDAIYVGRECYGGVFVGNHISQVGTTTDVKSGFVFFNSVTAFANKTGVTVTAATDKFALTSHGLSDGDRILLDGTMPAGLDEDNIYYVVNSTANDFEVSLEPGDSGATVDVTADGTVTVVDFFQCGGHLIANNHISVKGGGVEINLTDQTDPCMVVNNFIRNERWHDRAGDGVRLSTVASVIVRGNYFRDFNNGTLINISLDDRYVEEIAIDSNFYDDCGYCVRANTDGSQAGLVLVSNMRAINSAARIRTDINHSCIEGYLIGNGNIRVSWNAVPTFGTWSQGDIIDNREWDGTTTDPMGWVKTDAGTELHSSATFTAFYTGDAV